MSQYYHGPRADDDQLSRRELLRSAAWAWARSRWRNLLGASRARRRRRRAPTAPINPLVAQAAAVPRQGQARHPPLPERRAVAGRHVRPQARRSTSTPASRCRWRTSRTERKTGAALPSPFKFKKYGKSGIEVSELFPHVAEHADDLCVIRSMHADVPNHEPSLLLMNCGEARLDPPEHGLVGHLRPGQREPEPARLRRHVPRRVPDPGIAELAGRLPARRLPGHVHRHRSTRSSTS